MSGQPVTVDDLRASDCPVSPLMALLLGLPPDSPRIVRPGAPAGHGSEEKRDG